MASFVKMFTTYLAKFVLGNITSMLRESITKSSFSLSYYIYKSFALRLLYFIGYMSGKGKIITSIFCQSLYISLKKHLLSALQKNDFVWHIVCQSTFGWLPKNNPVIELKKVRKIISICMGHNTVVSHLAGQMRI